MTEEVDRGSLNLRAGANGRARGFQLEIWSCCGKRSVSATTKARIEQSVERLGYRPNLVARGLRNQRTHTIALLVADIANPYYPALSRAIADVITIDGYIPFICNTDGDAERERTFLHEVVARNVDGIILQAMSLTPLEVREIVGDKMPLT